VASWPNARNNATVFRRDTHIGQELHAAGNSSAGWTLSSASQAGIPQGLSDGFFFKIGIGVEDFSGAHPVGDQIQHEGDSDAHPPDTGATAHDGGIEGNAIQRWHNGVSSMFFPC
jgi:hypothetical protein